jgi:hypothetical protein
MDTVGQNLRQIKAGDAIVLKTAFTQSGGLPFLNVNNASIPVLRIVARGTVTEIPSDSLRIAVRWDTEAVNHHQDWYFEPHFQTLEYLDETDAELIAFIQGTLRSQDFDVWLKKPEVRLLMSGDRSKWIPIYRKIAEALNSDPSLLTLLQNVLPVELPDIFSSFKDLRLSTPFDLFALFNAPLSTENRRRMLGRILELLPGQAGVSAPVMPYLFGVPVLPSGSLFFRSGDESAEKKKSDSFNSLFRAALHLTESPSPAAEEAFISAFNALIRLLPDAAPLTTALYWIAPNHCLSLDRRVLSRLSQDEISLPNAETLNDGRAYLAYSCSILEKINSAAARPESSVPSAHYSFISEFVWDVWAQRSESDSAEDGEPLSNFTPVPMTEPLNIIYYGPPGTGKTYRALKELREKYPPVGNAPAEELSRIETVTFHQSYSYEEFVEGIRPVLDSDDAGDIRYEIKDGIFKALCQRASLHPEIRFALLIDEINRGNVSKIFGELITLIEPDKRQNAGSACSVTLPYSRTEFSVPQNLDIYGTMNTADRSLALMDTALRRRFSFVHVGPNYSSSVWREATVIDGVDLIKLLQTINLRITYYLDADHVIGHAYLMKCRTLSDVGRAFRDKILPLLEEYFLSDLEAARKILGDDFGKPAELQFYPDASAKFQDLIPQEDMDRTVFALRSEEEFFLNPQVYRAIYLRMATS